MSALIFPLSIVGAYIKSKMPFMPVRVDESASSKEARATFGIIPRWRYKLGFDVVRADTRADYQQLVSHFLRHFGSLDSFLIADPEDNAVVDHGFGVGDGVTTAFQVQRSLLGSTFDVLGGPWTQYSKPRTNLLTGSAAVLVSNNTPSFNTFGIVAPDGSTNATEAGAATGGGSSYSAQVISSGVGSYTASVWVRRVAGRAAASLEVYSDTLASQLVAFPGPSGSGWQRVSASFSAPAAGSNMRIYTGLRTTDSALQVWGGQIETGTVATPYIPTAGALVTQRPSYWPSYVDGFEPVFDMAPGALLFVEGDGLGRRTLSPSARTNVLAYSQGTGGIGWQTSQGAGITYGVAGAPDGTATAIQFVETATASYHDCFNANLTLTDGVWTGSIYVKRISGNRNLILRMQSKNNVGRSAVFDSATGAVVATPYLSEAIASGCEVCENGWLRLWASAPCSTTGPYTPLLSVLLCSGTSENYAGDGSAAILIWGGQVEKSAGIPAAGVGDYISTTTAAVSRTDYALNSLGTATFAVAPRAGAALSWTGNFYKRLRFEDPELALERIVQSMWSADVSLVTVKP